jgi:arogenate dehydrogenase (NADP+)
MQTIAIVGLGLIGGSLGLDFVAQGHRVLGIARRPETCELALARGVVHQADTHLSLAKSADIVFICTPIGIVVDTVAALLPHLTKATIVTDVASVKAAIVAKATDLWPNFVGGHPMAGKAQAGIEVAEPRLFVRRPYVLTPVANTSPQAVEQVKTLVAQLQGRLYECLPHEHDQAVAWISHLPVMVSSGLIQACYRETDSAILTLAQQLASSGFQDTSRVGGGDPQLGVMMAQYNQAALLRTLDIYQHQIRNLAEIIQNKDWDALHHLLTETQAQRPEFLPDP